jgi:glutathione S-transferase
VIWQECLSKYGGPFLFGVRPTIADAMYAPVTTRFVTYAVTLSAPSAAYCQTVAEWGPMAAWREAALAEVEEIEDLDVEF